MVSKTITCLLVIAVLGSHIGYSQSTKVTLTTTGDKSPAIIARKAHVNYGINAPVIKKLLSLFDNKKMSPKSINDSIAGLIRSYLKNKESFTCDDYQIRSALTWINIQTTGDNSPAVFSYGDVGIEYGIPYGLFKEICTMLMKYESNERIMREEVKWKSSQLSGALKELYAHTKISKAASIVWEGIMKNGAGIDEYVTVMKEEYGKRKELQASYAYILGVFYELSFNYAEAAQYFKDAAYNGATNCTYQLAYAENLRKRGKLDDCLYYYGEVKRLCVAPGKMLPDTLFYAYIGTGKTYQRIGRFNDALRNFDSARWCMQYSKQYTSISASYFFDAVTNYRIELGQFGKAHQEAQKLADLINKDSVSLLLPSANVPITLGSLYHTKGMYESSLNFFRLGLPKGKNPAGLNNPLTAEAYSGIASNHLALKKFDSAIYFFKMAHQINAGIFDAQSVTIASGFINLGVAFVRKGDDSLVQEYYDSAEVYYVKAWKIDSAIFSDGMHAELAIILGNLGELHTKKKEFMQAIACHERARNIYKEYYKNDHVLMALALNNLGSARLEWFKDCFNNSQQPQHVDSLEICLRLLRQSGTMMLTFFDSSHNTSKVVFNNIATALLYKGLNWGKPANVNDVLSIYRESISYALAGTDTTTALFTYGRIGILCKERQQWDTALFYLKQSIRLIAPQELPINVDSISKILIELKDDLRASILAHNYRNMGKCLTSTGNSAGEQEIIKALKAYALKRNDPDMLELLRKDGLIN